VRDVFWIAENRESPRLGIVTRPRGGDWLHDELLRLKNAGIRTVVSMLEQREADSLGLAEEGRFAEQLGLRFISFPVPDRTTPANKDAFRRLIHKLASQVSNGDAVGVHCQACIGRSTIAVACILIHLGWNPEAALEAIESSRGCSVPDTEEQREWILDYEVQK
jgi:protein-tyrosine phosphatase